MVIKVNILRCLLFGFLSIPSPFLCCRRLKLFVHRYFYWLLFIRRLTYGRQPVIKLWSSDSFSSLKTHWKFSQKINTIQNIWACQLKLFCSHRFTADLLFIKAFPLWSSPPFQHGYEEAVSEGFCSAGSETLRQWVMTPFRPLRKKMN